MTVWQRVSARLPDVPLTATGSRWLLPALTLTIALLPQAYKLTLPPKEQFSGFFPDDAFYYFKTALRVHDGGVVPSFDGLHATTGFHPLWMLVATALTTVTTEPDAYLSLILVGNFLFVALFSLAVWWALRPRIGWPLATAVICMLNWSHWHAAAIFTGLETPLSLLLAWLAIQRAVRVDPDDRAGLTAFGVLAGLAFLARTDFVLCMPLLAAVFWFRHSAVTPWRRLRAGLTAAVPCVALALPYVAWNWVMTGMLQPVSGAIKSLGQAGSLRARPPLDEEVASYLTWTWTNGLLGWVTPALAVVGVGVALLAALRHLRRRWSLLDDSAALLWCGFAAVVAVYYAVFYGRNASDWHLAPLAVASNIVVAYALADIARVRWTWPVVGILSLISLAGHVGDTARMREYYLTRNYHFVAPVFYQDEVSRWMATHLPTSATVGVFDAGYVGYFAGCRVVNLDGLINGRDLYDYYRDGRGVWRYIMDRRLDYVSNYYFGDPVPERSPIAPYLERVFQVGGREVFRGGRTVTVDWYVWRVRHEKVPPGLLASGALDGGIPPR